MSTNIILSYFFFFFFFFLLLAIDPFPTLFIIYHSRILLNSQRLSVHIIIIIIIIHLRVFLHQLFFFTGVWVTTSLLVSRTLLNILADLNKLKFGWSPFVHLFPSSPLSLYQSFGDCTERTNYNWYHRHFHIRWLFQFSSKVEILTSLFAFPQFYSGISWDGKVHNLAGSFFFSFFLFFFFFLYTITRSVWLAEIRWSVCIIKSQRTLHVLFF